MFRLNDSVMILCNKWPNAFNVLSHLFTFYSIKETYKPTRLAQHVTLLVYGLRVVREFESRARHIFSVMIWLKIWRLRSFIDHQWLFIQIIQSFMQRTRFVLVQYWENRLAYLPANTRVKLFKACFKPKIKSYICFREIFICVFLFVEAPFLLFQCPVTNLEYTSVTLSDGTLFTYRYMVSLYRCSL